MSRRVTVAVVLLAVVAGLGSTAQVEEAPIAPSHEEATEAELAFYDTEFPCPDIPGLESFDRSVTVDSTVRVSCRYRIAESGATQSFTVSWHKTDYSSYAGFLCFDESERTESGDTIRSIINNDLTHAIRAEISIDRGGAFEADLIAAAEAMMQAATPYSRECVATPDPLECPDVPGHPLAAASEEVDAFQVDTFSFECSYDPSSAESGDGLFIKVWWAPPRGVPELYDRLCNELPSEGVGVGVLVADDVAANATFWRTSPLEGPDPEVARAAAQDLLDQVIPLARSCDGAETLVSTYAPFPDYLAGEFSEELTAAPTGGTTTTTTVPGATTPSPAEDGGFIQTLLRIGSVVMLVVSILGLFITFLLIRRETRIRERRDLLRIVLTVAVAAASILIIGRHAPLWAVLIGIGLGVALGTWQGSNLIVRNTQKGLMARRNVAAIAAFAAGVILMQVAGLLNRTGAVAVGVAVSFLSAATTTGLFIGRKPRITEALGATARVLLPAAIVVAALTGLVATGEAQTDATPPGICAHSGLGSLVLEGCEGYQHLLDIVPWDDASITGGLWWRDGKPPTPISLPRGITTPPEPVSQTVTWSGTDFGDNPVDYEITETYSFGTLAEGGCCSVFYEGSGSATTTRSDGEVVVETRAASGRLVDIQPFGTVLFGEPLGIPFSETLTLNGLPEDSCQRVLAWPQVDNEEGAATWDSFTIDGEEQNNSIDTDATVFVDCDLSEFSYEHAFALAPPPPAPDDPAREVGGFSTPTEICPVRQEFAAAMWEAGQFDGVSTRTLAELFLEPNATACDYGGLFDPPAFGQGGRGETRHEIIYRLAILNDPVAEAIRLADDEDTFFGESRTTSIPPHERCEVGADGVPLPPPEGETCVYATIHSPGATSDISGLRSVQLGALRAVGGQVSIRTEYVPDGPNVWIRAHLPWGKYVYRCHHCEPGDPRITQFINSLHRFGVSRGTGTPPPPSDSGTTTETTVAVDPGDDPDVEFTPVEEEEGITPEEAALIGLVGLLGTVGLMGTALEGTGLTATDITEAIRRGDLTGGVGGLGEPDGPPPLLDEDGDPLFVNDGSYPEAPVGHVWWDTGGGDGRWVPPDEAEDLVSAAVAADEALQQDRAEALGRMREQADEDWQTLIRTSRAEAAEDRMRAAMERETAATLIEGAAEARDAAAAGGYDDLLDFLERNPSLTADQIQAVFDAINRRGADQAALDAIPEVNIVGETISGSLETMAKIAEKTGNHGAAWILRNPGVATRVGAAVATGGYSEFVAIPITITQQLQEAQERSLAENGRMMTSDELFGELGWALGTEAVYEAGGRLAAHGLGAIFSQADEVMEAGARQLDEGTGGVGSQLDETLPPAGSQLDEAAGGAGSQLDETLAPPGSQLDETLAPPGSQLDEAAGGAGSQLDEAATGAGSQLDETLAPAGSQLDEAATGAGSQIDETLAPAGSQLDEAATGAGSQIDETLAPPPPKGNETIRDLPTGAKIDDELIPETGLSRSQLDDLQDYTRENDLNVTGRATNPHSAPHLEDGSAVGKPIEMKIKTGTDLDVILGAKPQNRGVVTLFEPKMPDTRGMSPELIDALERRHAQRMAEWTKYESTWTRGNRVTEFGGVERTHRFIDGRVEVLVDGQWRKVAGDFDVVDVTRADGSLLSPAEFQTHIDAMVERGLIEHGGEVRVMTDVMRNNPHPPGSDEWMEAARDAWRLRGDLENAHLDNAEIIVGINGREGLHRGPRLDEFLPWRGGFEQAGGGLIGT